GSRGLLRGARADAAGTLASAARALAGTETGWRGRLLDWRERGDDGEDGGAATAVSLLTARSSILRTHSRVTPMRRPISLSVSGATPQAGFPPYRRPNRSEMTRRSRSSSRSNL